MEANILSYKDLMVGDLVKPKNVDASFRVGFIGVDSVWNDTDTHEWYYDELEPIPLTQEILEKNGFEKWDDGWCIYDQENTGIEIAWLGTILKIGGQCSNLELPDVMYVHQLQHALRLCGISKEIEL